MFGYYRDNLSSKERELQDEVDRLKYEEEQRRERESSEREERNRERERRYQESYRTASGWPEALSKQASLFQQEQNEVDADHQRYPDLPPDSFFGDGVAACRRGLEIWREVEAGKQAEIEALEKQIEAIRESIKAEVSQRLESEANGRDGWRSVAGAIVTEDPSHWLNW